MNNQEEYLNDMFWDSSYLLKANKNISYKKSTLITTEAVVNFYTDKNLFNKDIKTKYANNLENTYIIIGDLTEEGFEFSEEYFDKWLSNLDRSKVEPTLENTYNKLAKLYEKYVKSKT